MPDASLQSAGHDVLGSPSSQVSYAKLNERMGSVSSQLLLVKNGKSPVNPNAPSSLGLTLMTIIPHLPCAPKQRWRRKNLPKMDSSEERLMLGQRPLRLLQLQTTRILNKY
jgi:hypothetical protein